MADEINKPGEMPTTTEQTSEKPAETAIKPAAVTAEEAIAELERTRAALKEANKEAAARRKRLEELEAAEQKRKEADMSEIDRLKAQHEQATKELGELKLKQLRREVADELGLPPAMADRLRGATVEEMKADGETLKALLPKAPPKSPGPTNPGGAETGETDEQRRKRLFG